MKPADWTVDDIPDLFGKQALVTGATSGVGQQTVIELAGKGARVVMAGRSESRLWAAAEDMRRVLPGADLLPLLVNLADLGSVRRAADEVSSLGALDILVNNAAVMATPYRRTVDGFELQLGTNHLGHFALTGLLWAQLAKAPAARVVTVTSQAHRMVRSVPVGDPRNDRRHYRRWVFYAESKLANLLFALELERRARTAGTNVSSMAAHPGYTAPNLSTGMHLSGNKPDGAIVVAADRLLAQPREVAAQPTLMAATMPGLPGGSYVGPRGLGQIRGTPVVVTPSRAARNETLAARLWQVSEEATRVYFP